MQSVNSKIIVKVNLDQKNSIMVGDVLLSTATKFETNYREKSPVIAEVVNGNEYLKKRDLIISIHQVLTFYKMIYILYHSIKLF